MYWLRVSKVLPMHFLLIIISLMTLELQFRDFVRSGPNVTIRYDSMVYCDLIFFQVSQVILSYFFERTYRLFSRHPLLCKVSFSLIAYHQCITGTHKTLLLISEKFADWI